LPFLNILTMFLLIGTFSLSLKAEYQSVAQRIYAPEYMSKKQSINVSEKKDDSITLQSQQNGKKLLSDKKKSTFLIQSLDELLELPDPLVNRIISVITRNKKSTLNQAEMNKYYIFANFSHSALFNPDETELYIAILPRSASVTDLSLQLAWFGDGIGAESQIRFQFNKAIQIIPQISDSYPILRLENADFIYSAQTIALEGGASDWNFFNALMGEFAIGLQLESTQSKAKKQIKKAYVESYSFKDLDFKQRKTIFVSALAQMNEGQESGIYNSIYNNSITQVLKVLKSSLPRIDSQHFNPYTMMNMIGLAVDGRFEEKKSLNQEYQFLVKGGIMSRERLENASLYKEFHSLMKKINYNAFDNLVKDIAHLIIEKQLTYALIKNVAQNLNSKRNLNEFATNEASSNMINVIEKKWLELFPSDSSEMFYKAVQILMVKDI
jgi:hypothetical protein